MNKKIMMGALMLALVASSNVTAFAHDGTDDKNNTLGLNAGIRVDMRGDDDRTKADVQANLKADIQNRIKDWSFNPGVLGTVTAVNGNAITIKAGNNGAVYVVDTTNATVKNGIGSIAVGDTIFAQGAINGGSILATNVIETKSKAEIKDNMSGIVGTATAVNGSTITILGKNGTTYSVNASGATFWKDKKTASTISAVAIGDSLIIQGTVNGNAVVATTVYDLTFPKAVNNDTTVTGTVTAVNGNTITVLGTNSTTYTVNAANATVKSYRNESVGISKISVGDSVVVKGSVSGTAMTATTINDNVIGRGFIYKCGQFLKNIFGKK